MMIRQIREECVHHDDAFASFSASANGKRKTIPGFKVPRVWGPEDLAGQTQNKGIEVCRLKVQQQADRPEEQGLSRGVTMQKNKIKRNK